MQTGDPILTICVVSYNHEKYIEQALNSFLMQKTDFPFQIIVGDDASTDKTPEILRRYAEKYPDIVKPILREKNIQPINNSLDVYSRARTEFVAICDGDDYWTDENKLQMQVDFLRGNPDCSICYHPTRIIFENNKQSDAFYPTPEYRFNKKILTIDDLAKHNPMHTNSLVYRWRFSKGDIKDFMPNDICPGDYFLALLHAEVGDAGFIDRAMSVYRVNSGGMSFELHKNPDMVWLKYGFLELNFYRALDKHFPLRVVRGFEKSLERKSQAVLNAFVNNAAFDKLEKYHSEYPEYFQLAVEGNKADHNLVMNQDGREDDVIKIFNFLINLWRRRKKLLCLSALGGALFFVTLYICLVMITLKLYVL
jgi:glycosyltransferase involved in cell wall biosynthesis